MGLIRQDLIPEKNYWIISDPWTDRPFMLPKKVKFLKYAYVDADNREFEDIGSYLVTMVFEDDIRIPLYDSGMKTGHKVTKGYYVGESSAQVFAIMVRIAYPKRFDIKPRENFDYKWFRRIVENFERDHPELII